MFVLMMNELFCEWMFFVVQSQDGPHLFWSRAVLLSFIQWI